MRGQVSQCRSADAVADPEHRGLVGVARDAGRRLGDLHRLDVGMRPDEPLALVADPRRARPGLAVGEREDEVAEQRAARAQGVLGRVGGEAPEQQQVACGPTGHVPHPPSSGLCAEEA